MFDGSNRQHWVALDPVVFDDPKILILDTMPSVDSHKDNFYYADTSNRFWHLMSAIYAMPVETFPQRLELLKKNHIALWSVCASCDRYLSEQDTMDNIVLNNIPAFLEKYPTINRILCVSHDTYRLLNDADWQAISMAHYVPSTSAADLWYDSVEKLLPDWLNALGKSQPDA